jgi:hypothetical protein
VIPEAWECRCHQPHQLRCTAARSSDEVGSLAAIVLEKAGAHLHSMRKFHEFMTANQIKRK